MLKHFSEPPQSNQLKVLSAKGLSEAVACYVDKNDTEAIGVLIKYVRSSVAQWGIKLIWAVKIKFYRFQ